MKKNKKTRLGKKFFNKFSTEFWKEPGNSLLLISYDHILYKLYKLIQSFISWWCSRGQKSGRKGRREGRRKGGVWMDDEKDEGNNEGGYEGNSGGGVGGSVMSIAAICN